MTSWSSGQEWEARPSPPGSRLRERRSSFSSVASGSRTATILGTRERFSSEGCSDPTGILARRRRTAVQSGQLLLRRRQHQVVRSGADPLPSAGLPADRSSRRDNAGLAVPATKNWSLGTRAAERLYRVRGALGFDRTEPRHSKPYPFGPVPDEPAIAKARERLKRVGLQPISVAARHRHRQMDATREDAMGCVSRRRAWQDGRRELRRR